MLNGGLGSAWPWVGWVGEGLERGWEGRERAGLEKGELGKGLQRGQDWRGVGRGVGRVGEGLSCYDILTESITKRCLGTCCNILCAYYNNDFTRRFLCNVGATGVILFAMSLPGSLWDESRKVKSVECARVCPTELSMNLSGLYPKLVGAPNGLW